MKTEETSPSQTPESEEDTAIAVDKESQTREEKVVATTTKIPSKDDRKVAAGLSKKGRAADPEKPRLQFLSSTASRASSKNDPVLNTVEELVQNKSTMKDTTRMGNEEPQTEVDEEGEVTPRTEDMPDQNVGTDDDATEIMPIPPPAANLQRGRRLPATSAQPGAYTAGHQGMQRNAELQFDLVTGGADEDQGLPTLSEPNQGNENNNNEGLAHARPVSDQEGRPADLAQADEVDLEAQQRLSVKREARLRRYGAHAICVATLIVVLILVIVLSFRNEDGTLVTKEPNPAEPTQSPIPSMAPSDFPSSAPTGRFYLLVEELDLPAHTLKSLEDAFSPQYRAMEWLSGHQNITIMEEWRKRQLFVLVTFFYAMRGPHWTPIFRDSWLNDKKHECFWYSAQYINPSDGDPWTHFRNWSDWYPFQGCTEQGEYQVLFLEGLGFKDIPNPDPFVPPEIALLPKLRVLNLLQNGIRANLQEFLPTEIFQMTQLGEINLFNNNGISGTIPTEVALLTNLWQASFGHNNMTGTVPSELGLLTKLTQLYLHGNGLSGTIPTELGLLSNLQDSWMGHHEGPGLTGTLPSELFSLTKLSGLSLSYNTLTGTIPTQIGLMTTLENFSVGATALTGMIPTEIGLATSLDWLILAQNLMTGTLPSEIGLNKRLLLLGMWNGLFGGQLPSQIGLLPFLM